jgi:hypothetical protein
MTIRRALRTRSVSFDELLVAAVDDPAKDAEALDLMREAQALITPPRATIER